MTDPIGSASAARRSGTGSVTFSARTGWELQETTYTAALREARQGSRPLLDLTGSNPTRCGIALRAGDVLAALGDGRGLTYEPDARGLRSAREAVAGYYRDHGAEVDVDSLVLTASTSESYSFLFRLLCDPGDEVLIAQPSYPLFDLLADLDCVRLKPFPLFFDHGWWIDFSRLASSIGPRTRAIVVVHPNNPTGHWTRERERMQLEELCAEHDLALIVDEVFLDYPVGAQGAASTFAGGPHRALTFVLSGLSKIAALPQMKAAWMAVAGPDALRAEALARLEVIADTFLSVSTPVQLALPAWLAGRREVEQKILTRTGENLALLAGFAAEHPATLRLIPPEAGWTAIVSLPGCGGDPDCAERLVREQGIVLHPGVFYGMAEPNRAVLSLLTPPEILTEALRRL